MKRLAVAALVLVLAVLAVLLWTPDEAAERTDSEPETSAAERAEGEPVREARPRWPRHDTEAADEAGQDAEEPAEPAVELPTWTVRVIDSAGRPVVGARVRADGGAGARTDARGVARLQGQELVEPGFEVRLPDFEVSHQVVAAETEVEVPDPLPLSVALVDATTGELLPAQGRVRLAGVGELQPDPDHGLRVFLPRAPASAGGYAWFTFEVDAPEGYSAAAGGHYAYERISTLSRTLRFELLVHPVAPLTVRVVDETGEPVPTARVTRVLIPNGELAVGDHEADARGTIELDDLPLLASVPARIEIGLGERHAATDWLPLDALPREPVRVTLASTPSPPVEHATSLMGRGGGSFSSGGNRKGEATLVVLVRRRNGRPARGVRVRTGRRTVVSDELGRAVFEELGGRFVRLDASESGFLPTTLRAEFEPRGTTEVELREAAGRHVRLHVVDEEGRGLPGATVALEVRGRSFTLVDDEGAQRLRLHTDARGHLDLAHVPTGAFDLELDYGGRQVHASFPADETEHAVTMPTDP